MADFYTSAFLRRLTNRKGKPWVAVLKYSEPNPAYVEDTRTDMQRRKAFGKRPNTEYVEDTRAPEQRKPYIQRQITKTLDPATVKTKSQATTALETWREQMEAEHATPDASQTVAEYVGRYITTLEKLYDPTNTGTRQHKGISPTTATDYRNTMRYFGRGKAIGGTPLRALTVKVIEEWELSLLESGLNGTTVAKAHRLLWSACEYAVNHDDLAKNPARGVKTPSRTNGKRPNALDANGRARAMQALDAARPTPLTIAARLALYCGLRRGECCALTWGNVDLEGIQWEGEDERGPKIRVAQSIGEAKSGTYVKPPKSAAGNRVLALKGGIVDALRERRAAMWDEWSTAMKEADMLPTEDAFSTLYVCGRIDGSYCNPTVLTHEWTSFARQWGLVGTEGRYVTFHGLRDSYGTAAHSRGEVIGTIANNMGHSDPAMTLRRYATGRDSAAQAATNETVANDLDAARTGNVLPFTPKTGTDN